MYTTPRRGYRSAYRPRAIRRNYAKTPYKPVTKPSVNRRITFDSAKQVYVRRSIEDVHSGANMQLANQGQQTSYVNFPSLGVDGNGGRCFDHIKLLNLRVSGTVSVTQMGGDDPMGEQSLLRGIFVMAVIVDKRPFVPEGVNTLPTFKELFGEYDTVYGNPRLKDNIRHRYRLLGTVKQYITTEEAHVQKPVNLRRKLSNSRYPVWSSFKDLDASSTGGNYKNVNKNAILVSYVWVSCERSKCDVYAQFVLNYVG
ncbi:movement protein [East African cassava mosaic Cameroon virus]|uniref:Nuclear shuttle protein n=1 Tax=East African cassava mosaic Cameroon virus TaxID=223262 RepID=Q9WR07_9GEMI|nr:movement protein [East African cassava mosaic Cameroon virus]AAD40950.1 movement protein [East African cassava mosaic Cameroon virus]